VDRLGRRVADDEVSRVLAIRAEAVDRAQLAPPLEEVAHDAQFRRIRQRVLRVDRHDPVPFGQRDHRRHELAREVVPACADADCDGERQPARDREDRVFNEHPKCELVILQHAALVVVQSLAQAACQPVMKKTHLKKQTGREREGTLFAAGT
jgi:hypothetical protein